MVAVGVALLAAIPDGALPNGGAHVARLTVRGIIAEDRKLIENIFRRGDELNEDPLQGFLVESR